GPGVSPGPGGYGGCSVRPPGEGLRASLARWPGLPARSWTPDPQALVLLTVMPGQDVVAPVVVRVAPDRVNVLAAGLRVVVLDEQSRCLDPVVVPLPGPDPARPRE